MAESCRENCPIIALCEGQKHLAWIIKELGPERYASLLDRIDAIANDPDNQDEDTQGKIVEMVHSARLQGRNIAYTAEIAEQAIPKFEELIDTAVRECPAHKVRQQDSLNVEFECGGFSTNAIAGLLESQRSYLSAVNRIQQYPFSSHKEDDSDATTE